MRCVRQITVCVLFCRILNDPSSVQHSSLLLLPFWHYVHTKDSNFLWCECAQFSHTAICIRHFTAAQRLFAQNFWQRCMRHEVSSSKALHEYLFNEHDQWPFPIFLTGEWDCAQREVRVCPTTSLRGRRYRAATAAQFFKSPGQEADFWSQIKRGY